LFNSLHENYIIGLEAENKADLLVLSLTFVVVFHSNSTQMGGGGGGQIF